MPSRLAAAFVALALVAGPVRADDRKVVEEFYGLLNAATAPDLAARADKVLAPNWVTAANNTGGQDKAYFVKALAGLGQAVPNVKWQIVEILKDGNRYIVRGRATGTPTKPFLGVEPTGKSFDVMSIDIHTVENGKIVKSYHIEDWIGASRQLRAK
jgi:predicted ester cyclase